MIQISLAILLYIMIIKCKTYPLLYLSVVYLIFGVLLCIIFLNNQIESFPEDGMIPLKSSRPSSYYDKKIYLYVIILNCLTGLFKLLGGICILIQRNITIEIKETCNIFFI